MGLYGSGGHTSPLYLTARPRRVECYLPTATFPLGGHFPRHLPEKCLGRTQLLGSVCPHPGWSCPGFCVHFPFGRTGGNSEALCPKCLQKWDLRPRFSCQLPVATSLYLHGSHSHPRAIGALFLVGKGVEAQGLPSFLFQNGKTEKYLQIISADVKDFREGAVLQVMETSWPSPLVFSFF